MNSELNSYLFPKQSIQLESLQHFLSSTTPLMLLLGEPGVGKNTLLDQLVAKMQMSQRIVRLQAQADLQPSQLTTLLSHHWTIQLESESVGQRHQLEQILSDLTARDESCLLIVDNADTLPIATLAALSHLAIKQEDTRVPLHILLSGRPDLLQKVSSLQSKAIPRLQLDPLSLEETREYVQQFFATTQGEILNPPSEELIESFYRQSGGYPAAITQMTQELAQQAVTIETSAIWTDETPAKPVIHAEKRAVTTTPSPRGRHTVKTLALGALCLLLVGLWYQKNHSIPKAIPVAAQTSRPLPLPAEPTHATSQTPSSPNKTTAVAKAKPVSPTQTAATQPKPAAIIPPVQLAQTEKPKKLEKSELTQTTKSNLAATSLTKKTRATNKPAALKKSTKAVAPPAQTIAKKSPQPNTSSKTLATGYTLQLMGSHQPKALHTFINEHRLGKMGQVLKTQYKGKTWYIITYGHYATRQQALNAGKNLPSAIQNLHPWPRAMTDIHG